MIGLAAITALNAARTAAAALVIPCHSLIAPVNAPHAAATAPIATASGASQSRFRCTHSPASFSAGTAVSANHPANDSIAGPTLSVNVSDSPVNDEISPLPSPIKGLS